MTREIKNNARLNSITEAATDCIIVADKDGTIVLWNRASERVFGYTRQEALGKKLTIIIPREDRSSHENGISQFIETGEKNIIGSTIELTGAKSDGSHFPIELSLSSWEESNEIYVCGIIRDISVRKAQEEAIKNTLAEKDILIQEVHHRVKNNLQIINSLMKIYSINIPEESSQIFKDCRNKIHAMSLVHSSLYAKDDFRNVDLKEYILSFCNYFFDINSKEGVKLTKDLTPLSISMEKAVNFGLILSELITNSFKYAFDKNTNGDIFIKLRKNKDKIVFYYSDNGSGIPDKILNDVNPSTYGIQMIRDLVSQMDGTIDIKSEKGTSYSIKF